MYSALVPSGRAVSPTLGPHTPLPPPVPLTDCPLLIGTDDSFSILTGTVTGFVAGTLPSENLLVGSVELKSSASPI